MSARPVPSPILRGPQALAQDEAFRIAVDGSLKLSRVTEYCQWEEFKTRECDTCSRRNPQTGEYETK